MELRIPTHDQLRTIYHRDLKEAFPEAELKSLATIETMWDQGQSIPYCLFE